MDFLFFYPKYLFTQNILRYLQTQQHSDLFSTPIPPFLVVYEQFKRCSQPLLAYNNNITFIITFKQLNFSIRRILTLANEKYI